MAYGDDSFYMEGEDSLFGPSPMDKQKMLAANVRQNPALATPSGGVTMPKAASDDYRWGGRNGLTRRAPQQAAAAPAAPGAETSGPLSAAAQLRKLIEESAKPPEAGQYIEAARERSEEGNRRMMLGMTLAAMGGKGLTPFGQQLATQGVKDSAADYEIPGGWGTITPKGTVAWNEAKQREANLARDTNLYRIASDEETKREAIKERAASMRAQQDATAAYRESTTLARDDAARLRGDNARFRDEDRMATQYQAMTKTYREELDATTKVAQLAPTLVGRPLNAVEQGAMVYLLNKFLDPGSVVREGEYDRSAQQQGLIQRAEMLIPKLRTGVFLNPEMINEILVLSKFYETASRGKLQQIGDEVTRKALDRGFDPANVIIDPYYKPGPGAGRPGAPRPGTEPPPGAVREVTKP